MKIIKFALLTGLALLCMSSVAVLTTECLNTFQYCFVFGTMCSSALLSLAIIR